MISILLMSILIALCFACACKPCSDDAEKRAEELLEKMTLEEKIEYIGGTRDFYVKGIERLGIPEIKMSDGPMGCRCWGEATCYPAGIGLAASWNPEMAEKLGKALGRDCRARGVHILLAPGVNIYRSPKCGRNFEYLGEDPYLTSKMVVPLIQGIQSQGVFATVKHYICNNQEWDRHTISSEVDERTLREIYLPAFKAAILEGDSRCIMNAYNLLNGVHCSQSEYLLIDILKKEWGFDGFVMSDWCSTYDGVAAANAGLDLEMPSGAFMNQETLLPAVKDGRVKESVIDDKILRMLRNFIAAGFFDNPQELTDIPKDDPENVQVALDGAREGIVLLKNENSLLPLDSTKVKSIAVIGPNADPAVYCAGGSAFTNVFHSTSVLDGIKKIAGDSITVQYSADDASVAKQCDVAIVCIGFKPETETEGADRKYELPAEQVELIKAVSAANPNTIVMINSGGGVDWTGWLDKVPAVLQTWYSGQEYGQAAAEIVFGQVNPSGKLPATFEKVASDNPTYPYYDINDDKKTPYTEGIFVGYRGYDKNNIQPQFCFGFGLSYTTFSFADLKVNEQGTGDERKFEVTCSITNTGSVDGAEVAQFYIGDDNSSLPRPVKELKGFRKVWLKPGETQSVTFTVDKCDLAFYDPEKKSWITEPGNFTLYIGSSSRDLPLNGKLTW